jgi:hypothetical protein
MSIAAAAAAPCCVIRGAPSLSLPLLLSMSLSMLLSMWLLLLLLIGARNSAHQSHIICFYLLRSSSWGLAAWLIRRARLLFLPGTRLSAKRVYSPPKASAV